MGNCIQKHKHVVVGINNAVTAKNSACNNNDQSQWKKQDGTINAYSKMGVTIHGTNQANIEEYENNSKMPQINNIAKLNPPSPPGSMEQGYRQSHPLPTPDISLQTDDHHKSNNSLALPTPDSSPKADIDVTHFTATPQALKTSACILPEPSTESEILASPYLKAFGFDDLKKATSKFCKSSLLGEGGFGCVYKGWLDVVTLTSAKPGTGLAVAIKKLIPDSCQGHKEWLSEVNYLGRLRHPNLVKLIGYCIENEDRILVYEFMPGGSLENHLFKMSNSAETASSLSWANRIKIAIGAARGLCFLHESSSPVIYRDFKTSNILLDTEFNAKLSDFGLAKSGPTELQSHVSTRVMGTEGYCDPHYRRTGKLTVKCDVYSYGVVLLELLTGRRAIDETKCEEEQDLLSWVSFHLQDHGKIFRIMDSRLQGQYCKKAAYIAANIALRCVNQEPKYRPPMTYILEILENLPSQKPRVNGA